ncbi:hypothetical protein KI688_012790 [Linnemannia hyalina]|uniref:Uncharacterized protein n=1 Tax=Linnemannia hyalina TaxID=64524 RepID=A0A9P8BT64_9FUNG|nr:hypothetical protein KI688_012790 [Linnemannia hyalina]
MFVVCAELIVDPPERQDVLPALTELELSDTTFSDAIIPSEQTTFRKFWNTALISTRSPSIASTIGSTSMSWGFIPRDLEYWRSGQVPGCNWIPDPIAVWEVTVQFALMGRLYQQIGSLTELRRLNLRSLAAFGVRTKVDDQDYRYNLFSGLMSLADDEMGRQGCLGLLGGLSKAARAS